uniref:Receptor ligand binding region domain-containing protein n=1 Tax=Astyanax mexicanus TaxID=7994 RepID=A0A8B9GRE6_ASTMX
VLNRILLSLCICKAFLVRGCACYFLWQENQSLVFSGIPIAITFFKNVFALCFSVNLRLYLWLKTMIYTVEEINRDLNLLPNLTLGYMIADSCLSEGSALSAALSLVTGNVKVVSGEECLYSLFLCSSCSQVSYYASCACLSDRKRFPTFIRTVPSNAFQAIVIARLLNRMGWSWVGVIYGDDAYGQTSAQLLINEVQGSNVCMAYSEVIPKSYSQSRITQIVEKIQSSKAQVVVIFAISADTEVLIKEAVKRNVTDKQWIAPTSWSTAADFTAWCGISLVGTIGIALRSVEIQGLSSYLTNLSTEHYPTEKLEQNVWEEAFGCKFPTDSQSGLLKPKCSNLGNIQVQTAGFDGMYNVYKAVYAVAHAIQNMQDCEPGKGNLKEKPAFFSRLHRVYEVSSTFLVKH